MLGKKVILKIKIDDLHQDELNTHYKNSRDKAYAGDSGLDLLIASEVVCKAHRVTFINHKICCEMIRSGFFSKENLPFLLVPRSSLSKSPLIMANSIGIIDKGYRGSITAAVHNTSNNDYTIFEGSKLFQIILPTLEEFDVKLVNKLSITERGTNGYGSSNKIKQDTTKRQRRI